MQASAINTRTLAILLLAFFVRLLGIISRPIWYDEAFSILFSEKGLSAMLYGTLAPTGAGSADIHPLGYYTLLWLWMQAFGESIFVARLLSIGAGIGSVYLIYLIAWTALSHSETALLSMLLASLSPFLIHYAQEIRMYSFLTLWLLLSTYAFQRASRTEEKRWWIVFSVSAALAQYTHNLAVFYLIPLAGWPAFQKDWRTVRRVLVAGTGALILYLPWAIQLPAQFAKIQHAYWVERPDISAFFTLLLLYIANAPLPTQFLIGALVIALLIVTIGILQTIRQAQAINGKTGNWLLYLSFTPPLLLFLFSQWRPIYIERALVPSGAMFCIWLAWVVTRTSLPKAAQYGFLSLLGFTYILGMYQHLTYSDFPYGPFQQLDAHLRQQMQPSDAIVHSNKLSLLPAIIFDRRLSQSFIGDPPGSPTDTLAGATQQVLQVQAEDSIQTATTGANRVWYIIYERSIAEYQAAGHGTHPDLEYLESRFKMTSEEEWDGLRVFLFTREP